MKEVITKYIKKVILPNYPIISYHVEEHEKNHLWSHHMMMVISMDGKVNFEEVKKLKEDLKMLFDMIGTKHVQIDIDSNLDRYTYFVSGNF